jgi:hypothetical protein
MIVFVFVFAFVQMQHYDLLIVGAGLSGIGAAVHVQKLSPSTTYQILEARERSGGTWDLFQYPGIRSDSDMYTLGCWRFVFGFFLLRLFIRSTFASEKATTLNRGSIERR